MDKALSLFEEEGLNVAIGQTIDVNEERVLIDAAILSDPSAAVANEYFKSHMFDGEAVVFKHNAIGVELKSDIAHFTNAGDKRSVEARIPARGFENFAGDVVDDGSFDFLKTEDMSDFERAESFSIVQGLFLFVVAIELPRIGIGGVKKTLFANKTVVVGGMFKQRMASGAEKRSDQILRANGIISCDFEELSASTGKKLSDGGNTRPRAL